MDRRGDLKHTGDSEGHGVLQHLERQLRRVNQPQSQSDQSELHQVQEKLAQCHIRNSPSSKQPRPEVPDQLQQQQQRDLEQFLELQSQKLEKKKLKQKQKQTAVKLQQQEHQTQKKPRQKQQQQQQNLSMKEVRRLRHLEQQKQIQQKKQKLAEKKLKAEKEFFLREMESSRMLRGGKNMQLFQDLVDGEFYLLDGDSLLMEAAGTIGWRYGQQLHLFYSAECLLRLLADHGGSCRVLFLNVLGSLAWCEQPLMQLFRRALQLHLEANCSVPVVSDCANCWDTEFLYHMQQERPLFVLLHEGDGEFGVRAHAELKIVTCCSLMYNVPVVFSSTLQQADMKLHGHYIERRPEARKFFKLFEQYGPQLGTRMQMRDAEDSDEDSMLSMSTDEDADLGDWDTARCLSTSAASSSKPLYLRDWLAMHACRQLLSEATCKDLIELVSRWCLYFACMSALTYADRMGLVDEVATAGGSSDRHGCSVPRSLRKLAVLMGGALRHISDLKAFADPQSIVDIVDIVVYRMFAEGYIDWHDHGARLQGHPRAQLIADKYQNYAKQLAPLCQLLKLAICAPHKKCDRQLLLRKSRATRSGAVETSERPTLRPVTNRLVDEFAGRMLRNLSGSSLTLMDGDGTEDAESHRRLFDERRHWHNRRLLRDDLEAPSPADKNQLRVAPQMKHHLRIYGSSLHTEGSELVVVEGSRKKKLVTEKHDGRAARQDHGGGDRQKLQVKWKCLKQQLLSPDLPVADIIAKTRGAIESFKVKDGILEDPVRFLMHHQFLLWKMSCTDPDGEMSYSALADLVHTLHQYCTEPLVKFISPDLHVVIAEYFVKVGFSKAAVVEIVGQKKLQGVHPDPECLCPMSYRDFQMLHMGHLMQRNVRFDPDPRVTGFIPDTWQRELLDIVDRRESAVVIAPTSSGKTFCSYYCMRKVLEMSDETVVVYVAPTKALVNQIQASISAKLSKPALPKGVELCGVFTRDYSYMAMNCQILVTVPQCLELLLMSPRRQGWTRRIRYVIFDEVHCIGTGIGGVVWEYLICLIRCPFLALSATIHNKEHFHDWLQTIKKFTKIQDEFAQLVGANGAVRGRQHQRHLAPTTTGFKVNLVTYSERYSDIRTSVYLPADKSIVEVNPCVFLNAKLLAKNGFPSSLRLSPKEAHEVWSAAVESFQEDQKMSLTLRSLFRPEKFFGLHPISRKDYREYEVGLKSTISDVLRSGADKSEELLTVLKSKSSVASQLSEAAEMDIFSEFPEFADKLVADDRLPTIVFINDRQGAERLATSLLKHVLKKIKAKNIFKIDQEKQMSHLELFNCRELFADCAYFSSKPVTREIRDVFRSLMCQIESEDVKKLLILGVGYHHAGCTPKHKQTVEMLFRLGYMQLVVATATLALGIHMPCKTVVFAGDDKFLNALNYHQMSGRSGRRGFDNMGNIVFYGVPATKISHLIQADLPKLRGGFPMTCAFALRLLLLTGNATDREAAHAQAITVLNHPFAAHQSRDIMEQLKLYFLFSVEFLRRRELINHDGVPQDLAGLVCHISYHQPGNFVLAHLLRTRALRDLCQPQPVASSRTANARGSSAKVFSAETMNQLVGILCHLFTTRLLPRSLLTETEDGLIYDRDKHERSKSDEKASVVSQVLLGPLPAPIKEAVSEYNERTVDTYINYLKCVTGCGLFKFSRRLPFSDAAPLGDSAKREIHGFSAVSPLARMSLGSTIAGAETVLRQALLADSMEQLRRLLPLELLTDADLVPTLATDRHLNSYALDFFVHGNIAALTADNKIRSGDVYELLQDFMLVTKSVATVLDQLTQDPKDLLVLAFKQLADEYDQQFSTAFGVRRRPF